MGAEELRPPLPGIDHPAFEVLRRIGDMDKITTRLDAAFHAQKEGKRGVVRAVVVGAGCIGLHLSTAAAAFQPLSDTDSVERVTVDREEVVVTRAGHESVVILSLDD